MQIELSQSELNLIDAALRAWVAEPLTTCFSQAIIATTLRSIRAKPGEQPAPWDPTDENSPEFLHAKGEKEQRRREDVVILFRAKLLQAKARASEHDLSPTSEGA